MSWTEERVELLKKMWGEGQSASQIAKELGGVTRNAVIGKVHRLGLSNRAGASGGLSGSRAQSVTNRLWEGLSAHVYVFLHQTRLSDVIRNELAPCPAVPGLFAVVDED